MLDRFKLDYYRYTGSYRISFLELMRDHSLRYLLCLRGGALLKPLRKRLSIKYGLNLGSGENIGPGLYLGHAYGINVNPRASIGCNCSLHKGCTIGQENRGERRGCPVLGNDVWVGINSAVVGNITIGDNVLIAPLTYVNCDVPSNSIVLGSPCRVIPCENATEGYSDNKISFNGRANSN